METIHKWFRLWVAKLEIYSITGNQPRPILSFKFFPCAFDKIEEKLIAFESSPYLVYW